MLAETHGTKYFCQKLHESDYVGTDCRGSEGMGEPEVVALATAISGKTSGVCQPAAHSRESQAAVAARQREAGDGE